MIVELLISVAVVVGLYFVARLGYRSGKRQEQRRWDAMREREQTRKAFTTRYDPSARKPRTTNTRDRSGDDGLFVATAVAAGAATAGSDSSGGGASCGGASCGGAF